MTKSDREMLVAALGGVREIHDALQYSTPATAQNLTRELAYRIHQHLKADGVDA